MSKNPTSPGGRREADAPDDAFVGTIKRIITWGQENARQAIIGAVAILVVVGGATVVVIQQRSLERSAQSRLAQVQQTVASGNTELAIRDLQSYLERFGSTEAADQARLILADLLVAQERPQEAIEALGDLPEQLDQPFGLAAARLEAAALERIQRYDDAIRAYREIAANARFSYERREAFADAARLELQRGQPEQAVELFQQVLATFDSDEAGRGYYEMWLAEARARARTGEGNAVSSVPSDSATG